MNLTVSYLGRRKSDVVLNQKLDELLKIAAKQIKIDANVTATVKFVGKEAIRELNNLHRNIDKATDVLSFPFYNLENGKDVHLEFEADKDEYIRCGSYHLGDIVICRSIAAQRIKEYGYNDPYHICFLAVHGFLHLVGYDHQNTEEEYCMTRLATQIMDSGRIARADKI